MSTKFSFSELVDTEELQRLMESFYKASGIPIGIIDINGDILVATGWQDICVQFHRVHQETNKLCMESDSFIKGHLAEGKLVKYKCKNNLWDLGIPIIIAGEHLATLFLGQFFYDDETVDYEYFAKQARRYGFDEEKYIAALKRVPVFTHEKVDNIMDFYLGFVKMIAGAGLVNLKLHEHQDRLEDLVTVRTEKLEEEIIRRRAAENDIRKEKEFTEKLIESATFGIFSLDKTGVITFLNSKCCEIIGYEDNEMTGKHYSPLFSESLIAEINQQFIKVAVLKEKLHEYESEIIRKNGEIRKVSINASPLVHGDEVTGVVGTVEDITDKKIYEENLKRAKEQAEEATKLKDKFVSLVAHDLKSPLTSSIGFASLIESDTVSPLPLQQREILRRISEDGARMINMIDEILNISRLQSGKIKPNKKFFNGQRLAASVIGQLSHLAEEKKIEIVNNIPAGLRLYADESLFEQVLLNLLSNAIKFCSTGDVVTFFQPPGKSSAIAVSDTGIGIPQNILPHIFRQEIKTSTQGTAGEKGTGFGLPLSHDIMTSLGGTLHAESTDGRGSVFFTELPDIKPVALIVDNDVEAAQTLKNALAYCDMEILIVETVKAAEDIIASNEVHVIISEITTPEPDGFSLLANVRKSEETSPIPFMVVTSQKDIEVREKAFNLGANDFIGKPINAVELIPRMKRMFDK